MAKNGGVLKSDDPNDPQQNLSEQGAANDPEIDHIIPMSAGGSNWFSNARVISWELNNSLARIKDITGLIDTSQLAPPIFPTGSTWEEKMDEFLPRYLPRLKGQFDVQDIVTVLTTSYNVTVKKKALGAINTVLGKLVAAGDLTLTAGKYRAAR
jgi:hypothetical protein